MAVQAWQTFGCYINMDGSKRELNPHGTYDFPVACYLETIRSGEGQYVPEHWHADLEFLAVVSGRCSFGADGHRGELAPGDAVFFNRGCRHSVVGAPEAKFASVVFSPVIVAGMPDSVFSHRYMGPLLSDGAPAYATFEQGDRFGVSDQVQRTVDAAHRELPGYEFAVRDALSRCVYAAWERMGRPAAQGNADAAAEAGRLNLMCMYVKDHLSERFSVADIATAAGVSERECLRTFKKSMGVSPVRYVTQSRLSRAAALLVCEPGKPVADIAAETGFTTPGYFAKLFRHEYGCTPRDYRARMHDADLDEDAVMQGYPLALAQAPAEMRLGDPGAAATGLTRDKVAGPASAASDDAAPVEGTVRPAAEPGQAAAPAPVPGDELLGEALLQPDAAAVIGVAAAPHVPEDALGHALDPLTSDKGTIG